MCHEACKVTQALHKLLVHRYKDCCSQTLDNMLISYQLKLIKVCAKSATLNHCAVPFLSRSAVNLSWYDSITYAAIDNK